MIQSFSVWYLFFHGITIFFCENWIYCKFENKIIIFYFLLQIQIYF